MHKLVMDVDGTGYRALSAFERRILISALETYRKCKAAEGKLREHKTKDDKERETLVRQYKTVLDGIKTLQETL